MKNAISIVGIVLLLLTACSSTKNTSTGDTTQKTSAQPSGDTGMMLAKPPAELVGRWNFTKLPNEVGDPVFTKEYLVFNTAEMRVNGKASCNGFFGNYTADTTGSKKAIHFEAIGHTMMACENLSAENKMLKAMEKVTNWSREGEKLYLKAGTGTLIEPTRSNEKNEL